MSPTGHLFISPTLSSLRGCYLSQNMCLRAFHFNSEHLDLLKRCYITSGKDCKKKMIYSEKHLQVHASHSALTENMAETLHTVSTLYQAHSMQVGFPRNWHWEVICECQMHIRDQHLWGKEEVGLSRRRSWTAMKDLQSLGRTGGKLWSKYCPLVTCVELKSPCLFSHWCELF